LLFLKGITFNFIVMKCVTLLFFSLIFLSFHKDPFKHKGLGDISVVKAYSQNVLGKNIGYYVEFKNNGAVDVDALKWKALFYDNFGDYKGQSEGKWSSGNFVTPIKKGETKEDLESAWIKDASKVVIKITRVHLVNGKSFGK
jgi:hypothetical protein